MIGTREFAASGAMLFLLVLGACGSEIKVADAPKPTQYTGSAASASARVPNVGSMDEATARAALEGAGFTVRVFTESSNTFPAGVVSATKPGSNQIGALGSEVLVFISSGPLPSPTTASAPPPTTARQPTLADLVVRWVNLIVDEDVARDQQEVFAYINAALADRDMDALREICADGLDSIPKWREVFLSSPFPRFNATLSSAFDAYGSAWNACLRGDLPTMGRYHDAAEAATQRAREVLRSEAPPELTSSLPSL